jgi:C-terminal peptidase prc
VQLWSLLFALALSPIAVASPSERAYDRSIELIERLYMYPDEITPNSILVDSTDNLSRKLHWLMTEHKDEVTTLRHGDGTVLATLSADSFEELPETLRRAEAAVIGSAYDLEETDVRLALVSGITMGLDRYSRVLSGERLKSFDVRLKGTLVGIGATLRSEDGDLVVVSTILGGPAELAGLKEGDVISRIDDFLTLNMPLKEATRRIQGALGTMVKLDVLRDGLLTSVEINRAEVTIPNVVYKLLPEGIGYISISHISQRTVTNLKAALSSLRDIGGVSRGLVIDLRGNTGGSMKEAARSADEFLHEGLLLRTAGPNGGPIPNLQGRMDAIDSNAEPPVPIAVLVDRRTASGAEILAGALLEHERAVLIGEKTYGKGSVQKIYNLDEETRLKLTVAEYFLANDRQINNNGLIPDLNTAFVDLNQYGVRLNRSNTSTDWSHVLPIVREAESWNGRKDQPEDLPLEVARRIVANSEAPDRISTLNALTHQFELESNKQRGHLLSLLEENNLNWSPGPSSEVPIKASVLLQSQPSQTEPNHLLVQATITNEGVLPLGQVMVQLKSDETGFWNNIAIPFGWVEPGDSASGETTIPLRSGITAREDRVLGTLSAAGRPPLTTEAQNLLVQSESLPLVSVEARYTADQSNPTIDVRIKNYSKKPLQELAAYLESPESLPIELIDRASTLAGLSSGQESHLRLRIRPTGELPQVLPVQLVVESNNHGKLVDWRIRIPSDGSSVRAVAPRITDAFPGLRASTGPKAITFAVTDDRRLKYAIAYHNGKKIAWHNEQERALGISVSADIVAGPNLFILLAEDDQGLTTRYQRVIQGDEPAAVDALEPTTE